LRGRELETGKFGKGKREVAECLQCLGWIGERLLFDEGQSYFWTLILAGHRDTM